MVGYTIGTPIVTRFRGTRTQVKLPCQGGARKGSRFEGCDELAGREGDVGGQGPCGMLQVEFSTT
jgi:hypothetical protein